MAQDSGRRLYRRDNCTITTSLYHQLFASVISSIINVVHPKAQEAEESAAELNFRSASPEIFFLKKMNFFIAIKKFFDIMEE